MQEQNSQTEQKNNRTTPQKKGVRGIIIGTILAGVALGGIFWGYSQLPDGCHRDLSLDLPWENAGLIISEADASWRCTQGNVRMEKRTRLYPHVTFKLKAASGKGRIDVVFLDPLGTQIGDTHYLRYENGSFQEKDDLTVKAGGDTVSCWLETGFPSDDMFKLHQINQQEPLWRVVVYHRIEGTPGSVRLGQISIPAKIIQ